MRKKLLVIFLLPALCLPLLSQEVGRREISVKTDYRVLQNETISHDFDVLHYSFHWTFNLTAGSIQGEAAIKSKSTINGLNTVVFHLADTMAVTQVKHDQASLSFSHADNLLTVHLLQSVDIGGEFEIEITYSGIPQSGLNFSNHEGRPIFWSLDEPNGARQWFPCYDHPSDKATAEMTLTVPGNIVTASNGVLVQTQSNPDGTLSYIWRENNPISTYLISVAGTNYSTFSDVYVSGTQSMPVDYFVYPEDLNDARVDFAVTVPMIAFYSQLFGEYPFLDEKYGMAAIPGGTAMEHQTCTSYPASAITGDNRYDWLIAHELAHMWWGDLVTLEDWPEIWLNEGFATYSDALWWEHLYGLGGLTSRMEQFKNYYFQHGGDEHPIYNPPVGHLFCEIIYEKAAWVLHMLRFVMGDDDFFRSLRQYARDFAYDNVVTSDFRGVCEQVSGMDLGWFFQQWIYQAGYPIYEFGWGSRDGRVLITINQIQTDFPLFRMPLELEFDLPSGPVRRTVWVEQRYNRFEIDLGAAPVSVRLDPDNWILHTQEQFFKKGKTIR